MHATYRLPKSDIDFVFCALADQNRRALLDSLCAAGAQTLNELCGGLAMMRQAISKHLAILEMTNLFYTTGRGREKLR